MLVLLFSSSALGEAEAGAAPAVDSQNTHTHKIPIRTPTPPLRLISLNPSLTAILLRLDAASTLVGVDDYSAQLLPGVAGLPKVGGLFDPSLESILALRPDRVLIVAGIDQQSHAERLEALGIRVELFENARLDQVLENISRLGRIVGQSRLATSRTQEISATYRAVKRAVAGRPRPGTLAIVDRSPLYLVGGATFLDEMLDAVGAENLARALGEGYPRGSIEWLIESKPKLLLDLTPGVGDGALFWRRWPSLPAVAKGRVLMLDASRISLPGPELDRAIRELAIAVHGPEIDGIVARALESEARSQVEAGSSMPGAARREVAP